MYGYGDDPSPLPETIAIVEDILVEYVTVMTRKAMDGCKTGELGPADFMGLLRKDLPKLNRAKELLAMQKEIEEAQKLDF